MGVLFKYRNSTGVLRPSTLARFAGDTDGPTSRGAFLLFTSNKQLRRVAELIEPELERAGVLVWVQGRGQSRAEMLAQFKQAHADGTPAVIFGVKSFMEGVDVAGAALSLVMVDKMPFVPPTDVVWKARCNRVNERAGNPMAWWNELALPTATIAIEQAVGRLIRTTTDTGVMAVLDGRLVTRPWRHKVLRALPPAPVTNSLADVRVFLSPPTRKGGKG
jgi:ATP-dependent DNA helicase DinG